jgi:hypothetical protein
MFERFFGLITWKFGIRSRIRLLREISSVPAYTLDCMNILKSDYGHELQAIVDKEGCPLPWFTYPAIEYIMQLDFSDKLIFEYGCGNSTLFWGTIAKRVVSVDDNQEWFQKIARRVSDNTSIKLITERISYITEILNYDLFDVVIVDGSYRYECAQQAIKRLRPGGMIILDNSDWCIKTARLLREANLIEVDMSGFGPYNPYTWTTSFFLHREFNFQPKGINQPEHGIGSWKKYIPEA